MDDNTISLIKSKIDAFLSRTDDHETRLRSLERRVWIASGAAAVVGGTIAQVIAR
jgi:hypothetical protein